MRAVRALCWTASRAARTPFESGREQLKGPDFAVLDTVVKFPDDAAANAFLKARDKSLPLEKLGCAENLFLARNSLRMFDGVAFGEIRIAELSVSVSDSPGTFGKIYAAAISGAGGFEILRARDFPTPRRGNFWRSSIRKSPRATPT